MTGMQATEAASICCQYAFTLPLSPAIIATPSSGICTYSRLELPPQPRSTPNLHTRLHATPPALEPHPPSHPHLLLHPAPFLYPFSQSQLMTSYYQGKNARSIGGRGAGHDAVTELADASISASAATDWRQGSRGCQGIRWAESQTGPIYLRRDVCVLKLFFELFSYIVA